jgi:hypothetical protein
MLLTVNSAMFRPPTSAGVGKIEVDTVAKIARFQYPSSGFVPPPYKAHVDVVDWSSGVAVDFFWQYNESGVINSSCEKQPFGAGSNRTPV